MRPLDLWETLGDADKLTARASQPWLDEIRKDCNLRRAHMVVELITGDLQRFRAATSLLEAADQTGADRWVAPALLQEEAIVNNYDIGSGSGQARSFKFDLPAEFVQPFDRYRHGFPIAGFAEVSLLTDGMAWNDRRVVMRGDLAGGVSFGPVRECATTKAGRLTTDSGRMSFQVQDPRESTDAEFPPILADADRYPDIGTAGVGQPIPVVYGGGTVQCVRVDPSNLVPHFVIALGHGWSVSAVYLDSVLQAAFNYTVVESYDGAGAPITLLDFSLGSGPWTDSTQVLASISREDPGEADLPQLTDVIRSALTEYGPAGGALPNPQLFADAQARLGNVRVQTEANTSTTLLSWIEGGLLDSFPMVSMVWEAGRYGPIVTDWRATERTQMVCGTERLPARLGDPVESPKGEAYNAFTVRYAYDAVTDNFGGMIQAGPDDLPILSVSAAALGLRPYPVIESVHIQDGLTAGYVMDWLTSHLSLPTFFVQYVAPACVFWELRRGDPISLTDEDLGWYGVKATIERMVYSRGRVVLGIRVWQNALRTGRFSPPP